MKKRGGIIIMLFCVALGNRHDSVTFLDSNCGALTPIYTSDSSDSSNSKDTFRILNGGIGNMFGNPWMALIMTEYECTTRPGFRCVGACGGSLISPRFVLSAAHCRFSTSTTITLGAFDWTKPGPNSITVPANLQIRHPYYVNRDITFKNDIALYRLARAVRYTELIRPICLPTNFNPLDNITHLTASGWGKTEFGHMSNVLMTTTLEQHDRTKCSNTFIGTVDMSQICAGSSMSQACSGDSGGPITSVYPIDGTNRVIQLGIVSYGGPNCRTVGVFTNVMFYMNWIIEIAGKGKSVRTTPLPREYYSAHY
ncbi:mast cell protease 1A-like [Drosophila kikkawai]|uniref:Chymotrypsinogen B-like n=1 Tax=Drosophila kikkawai TaxID=30033 RepID=A0A6P4I299_DROKI|nr:chymotrypsinogen B-like [Drosophila kikkawai]